jgi:hypothetical protein
LRSARDPKYGASVSAFPKAVKHGPRAGTVDGAAPRDDAGGFCAMLVL